MGTAELDDPIVVWRVKIGTSVNRRVQCQTTSRESRSNEAIGTKIISDAEVSFGPKPNIIKSGIYTFFAGSRSDAFFFDFDGIRIWY
jgi:hypothetical protein